MALTPYRKLLTMAKEAVDEALAVPRAFSAKKKAELAEKVATLEKTLMEECSKKELDFERIIDIQDEIALNKRKQSQFATIITEMFPD